MKLWERIRESVNRRAQVEADALDAQISQAIWEGQVGPLPRIVRLDRVNIDQVYEIPGTMFPDGHTRLFANPNMPQAVLELELARIDQAGSDD